MILYKKEQIIFRVGFKGKLIPKYLGHKNYSNTLFWLWWQKYDEDHPHNTSYWNEIFYPTYPPYSSYLDLLLQTGPPDHDTLYFRAPRYLEWLLQLGVGSGQHSCTTFVLKNFAPMKRLTFQYTFHIFWPFLLFVKFSHPSTLVKFWHISLTTPSHPPYPRY